jgi:hypothetical protein
MESSRFFKLGPGSIMLQRLTNTFNALEKDNKNAGKNSKKWYEYNQDVLFILYNLIKILTASKNDHEAHLNVMHYLLHLPVQPKNSYIQSLGESLQLGVSEIKPLPDDYVISDESKLKFQQKEISKLRFFQNICRDFMKEFKDVLHDWNFSYGEYAHGEIMTRSLGDWQKFLMRTDFPPEKSYVDYLRDASINGLKGNTYYVISLPSFPNEERLTNLLQEAKGACMIYTPKGLFFIKQPEQVPMKMVLSEKNLKLFEKTINPSDAIKIVLPAQLEELEKNSNFPAEIITNHKKEIITWNITHLCDQLKNTTQEDRKLFSDWLKMNGGQDINFFVASSFMTGDFLSTEHPLHVNVNDCVCTEHNWIIKDNQLTCIYKMDIYTLTNPDKAVMRAKDNLIHVMTPEDIHDLKKSEGYTPLALMSIDSEITLEINNQAVVKPKLMKYDVHCFASKDDAGETLIQSPAKNENIMAQLKGESVVERKLR